MATLISTNPATGEKLGEVSVSTPADIATALAAARAAQPAWRALGVEGRANAIRKLVTLIERDRASLAQIMTAEMGMSVATADNTVARVIERFGWYADNAAKALAPLTTFENDKEIHQQLYEPYGVAAVIAPWNYPLSNFAMSAGQAMLAGNTIVLKMSEEVPLFAQQLQALLNEAGLGDIVHQVYGAGDVGEALVKGGVDFLSFVGSSATGQKLSQICAERFIPCLLELGGSDVGIVFADADLDTQIDNIIAARFGNCGQTCWALKRLLVERSIFDQVFNLLQTKLSAKKVGNPAESDVFFGPLAARRQVEVLTAQIDDARTKGATVTVCGALPANLNGAFYPPTLLTNVTPAMRAYSEELFGPVLALYPFDSEDEAIKIANATDYGLSGYVYTEDAAKFRRIADRIITGSVIHNGLAAHKPWNPSGGAKHSGMGKTGGLVGFTQVSRVKMIATKK